MLLDGSCDPLMTTFLFLHIAGEIDEDLEPTGIDTSTCASYGMRKIKTSTYT